VDTQNKRIDEQISAPSRPATCGFDLGPKNGRMARRMLEEGRMKPAGLATLPDALDRNEYCRPVIDHRNRSSPRRG
jgi:hypothetical protein